MPCLIRFISSAAELPAYTPPSQRNDVNASMSVELDQSTGEVTESEELLENSVCYFEFNREKLRKIRSGMPVEVISSLTQCFNINIT